jgi:hypothetical protein
MPGMGVPGTGGFDMDISLLISTEKANSSRRLTELIM